MQEMLKFEELENIEELGDGWIAIGVGAGVIVGCIVLYVGIAT